MAPDAALSTAYLGDLAVLAPVRDALVLEIQRWFGGPPGAPRQVLASDPHPGALTVAMDFRSDALAAWTAGGSVWARPMPASGRFLPAQRLGPAGTGTRIASLLSDDNRAIVMWTTQRAGAADTYFDQSATGPSFGAARRIEHAPSPDGVPAPAGSPQLVRLSSESVMCAWAGVEGGRWAIRSAPVDQRGMRAVSTLAAAGTDALLGALAPGPSGDAVMLLTEPQAPGAGPARALLAARGTEAAGRTLFGAPEPLGTAGSDAGATVALEPGTDRALAAWRGADGAIHWSQRSP